jgi:hypothetical protein
MTTLPAPIAAFRDRTNAGDADGVLALFPADGVVEDWGRRFVGQAAIRGWSDEELVGAKGHLEITGIVSATAAEVVVETDWKSNFFSGAGRMIFALEGDMIRQLTIPEA